MYERVVSMYSVKHKTSLSRTMDNASQSPSNATKTAPEPTSTAPDTDSSPAASSDEEPTPDFTQSSFFEEATEESEAPTVLHVITGLEPGGGAEAALSRLLPRLQKTKSVVCSMLPAEGRIFEMLEEANVPVHSLEMSNKLDVRAIWRFRTFIQELEPAVVVGYLKHADMFSRVFSRLFSDATVVAYIRNRHDDFFHMLSERFTMPMVDCLLTNSRAVMQFYEEHFSLPECREVIPNGVILPDLRIFDNADLWDDLGLEEDEIVITSVARLVEQKDIPTLLKAFQKARYEYDEPVRLLLCGEGDLRMELENEARALGIHDYVEFLGKRKDVADILKLTDIFVLPSLKEGMSNALLEAMSSECACVVSNIPENTELIEDKQTGLVFEVKNPGYLADHLKVLCEDKTARNMLGKNARCYIERQYSLETIASKLDNWLYERSTN